MNKLFYELSNEKISKAILYIIRAVTIFREDLIYTMLNGKLVSLNFEP